MFEVEVQTSCIEPRSHAIVKQELTFAVQQCLSAWLGAELLDVLFFFFQAEDGIRDVERSRGLGDVYKRQDY